MNSACASTGMFRRNYINTIDADTSRNYTHTNTTGAQTFCLRGPSKVVNTCTLKRCLSIMIMTSICERFWGVGIIANKTNKCVMVSKRKLIQLLYDYYILSMESRQVFTKRFMLVVWALMRFMMKSSNGNIFRVTAHLCGEFTCPRWIPRTNASDAELWCFLWSASE